VALNHQLHNVVSLCVLLELVNINTVIVLTDVFQKHFVQSMKQDVIS